MIKLTSGYEEMEITKEEDLKQLETFFTKVVPNGVLVEYNTGSNFIFFTEYVYNFDKDKGMLVNLKESGKSLARQFIKTIEKQNIVSIKGNVQ